MSKVITGKVRFSYLHVFEPYAVEEDGKKKYSVSLIIPKSDKVTIKKIRKAIADALEAGKAKFGGKIPKTYKNPLRDGDDREDENYEDCFYVSANSDRKPGLVDENTDPIMDQDDFYSGMYGRASVNFYAFNVSGNKGIACGLNNLQKLGDGDRLGGSRTTAQDDFGSNDDDLT